MVAMRDRGLTFEEIGEALEPPLTKQRVEAIFRGGPPKAIGRPPGATHNLSQAGRTMAPDTQQQEAQQ
jgi:hypothetical protein